MTFSTPNIGGGSGISFAEEWMKSILSSGPSPIQHYRKYPSIVVSIRGAEDELLEQLGYCAERCKKVVGSKLGFAV